MPWEARWFWRIWGKLYTYTLGQDLCQRSHSSLRECVGPAASTAPPAGESPASVLSPVVIRMAGMLPFSVDGAMGRASGTQVWPWGVFGWQQLGSPSVIFEFAKDRYFSFIPHLHSWKAVFSLVLLSQSDFFLKDYWLFRSVKRNESFSAYCPRYPAFPSGTETLIRLRHWVGRTDCSSVCHVGKAAPWNVSLSVFLPFLFLTLLGLSWSKGDFQKHHINSCFIGKQVTVNS